MARLLRSSLPHTPDLAALAQSRPDTYPFFLNSSAKPLEGSYDNSRFDILLAFPRERLWLSRESRLFLDEQPLAQNDFLAQLDRCHQQARVDIDDEDLPFRGGWFIYLSYELAGQIESRLALPPSQSQLPMACAVRIPAAVILDRRTGETTAIAEPGYRHCLEQIEKDVAALAGSRTVPERNQAMVDEAPAEEYIDQIKAIKRYIKEGDVFQVNLSRQWQGTFNGPQAVDELYRQLVQHNPAPFAGLVRFGSQGALLSSSPERLIKRSGEWVDTRPIAGTHPRLENERADRAQREALIRHPKERAEHIMLIDLERNDLGRICEPGCVEVSELMVLESYAHVHHIVSNVRGRLRKGVTPGQIIAACFPGGTITGCPKVRCMEIIAELEQQARGPYTGSLGYLNHDGDMDLNILIRTIAVEKERVWFRAGAGIVADSDPQRELE